MSSSCGSTTAVGESLLQGQFAFIVPGLASVVGLTKYNGLLPVGLSLQTIGCLAVSVYVPATVIFAILFPVLHLCLCKFPLALYSYILSRLTRSRSDPNIFLPKHLSFLLLFLVVVQLSRPYISSNLTAVLYTFTLFDLDRFCDPNTLCKA